jgi:hypothetical protein
MLLPAEVPLGSEEVNVLLVSRKNPAMVHQYIERVGKHKVTHLDCGIALILLQKGRYMHRGLLHLPHVVLRSRIVGNIFRLCLRR